MVPASSYLVKLSYSSGMHLVIRFALYFMNVL